MQVRGDRILTNKRALVFGAIFILAASCGAPRSTTEQAPIPEATTQRTPVAPPELRVLQQTAEIICPPSEPIPFNTPTYRVETGLFVLSCDQIATSVRIERYTRVEIARAAFRENTGPYAVGDFHGRPSLALKEVRLTADSDDRVQTFEWRLEIWIIRIISSDETALVSALEPRAVAEIVYQIVEETGLLGK